MAYERALLPFDPEILGTHPWNLIIPLEVRGIPGFTAFIRDTDYGRDLLQTRPDLKDPAPNYERARLHPTLLVYHAQSPKIEDLIEYRPDLLSPEALVFVHKTFWVPSRGVQFLDLPTRRKEYLIVKEQFSDEEAAPNYRYVSTPYGPHDHDEAQAYLTLLTFGLLPDTPDCLLSFKQLEELSNAIGIRLDRRKVQQKGLATLATTSVLRRILATGAVEKEALYQALIDNCILEAEDGYINRRYSAFPGPFKLNASVPMDLLPYAARGLARYITDVPEKLPEGHAVPPSELTKIVNEFFKSSASIFRLALADMLEAPTTVPLEDLRRRVLTEDPTQSAAVEQMIAEILEAKKVLAVMERLYTQHPDLLTKSKTVQPETGTVETYHRLREQILAYGGRAPRRQQIDAKFKIQHGEI